MPNGEGCFRLAQMQSVLKDLPIFNFSGGALGLGKYNKPSMLLVSVCSGGNLIW